VRPGGLFRAPGALRRRALARLLRLRASGDDDCDAESSSAADDDACSGDDDGGGGAPSYDNSAFDPGSFSYSDDGGDSDALSLSNRAFSSSIFSTSGTEQRWRPLRRRDGRARSNSR